MRTDRYLQPTSRLSHHPHREKAPASRRLGTKLPTPEKKTGLGHPVTLRDLPRVTSRFHLTYQALPKC